MTVTADGNLRLRGVNLGGWLVLETPWPNTERGLVWQLFAQTLILYGVVLLPVLWLGRRIAHPLRHSARGFVALIFVEQRQRARGRAQPGHTERYERRADLALRHGHFGQRTHGDGLARRAHDL